MDPCVIDLEDVACKAMGVQYSPRWDAVHVDP